MKNWLVAIAIIIVGGAAGAGASFVYWQAQPAGIATEEIEVLIEAGTSPRSVAGLLEDAGVVSNAGLFYGYIRILGVGPELQAGTFVVAPLTTRRALVKQLQRAPGPPTVLVTIPEGYRATQIAARLAEAGVVQQEDFLSLFQETDLLAELGIDADRFEGYLYPDTYEFVRGTAAEDVVRVLVRRWWSVWNSGLANDAEALGWTPHRVVTLASIVEKETGAAVERPIIAGVFRRRLEIGMKLQADPTIIYGLSNYDGNIRKRDIQDPHPWNTYVHYGLPPTPICSPGRHAMDAVLHPDDGDSLYFVAKADGTGLHDFSSTYKEHASKVRKYRP